MISLYFDKFTIVFIGVHQDPNILDSHLTLEESSRICVISKKNQRSNKLAETEADK